MKRFFFGLAIVVATAVISVGIVHFSNAERFPIDNGEFVGTQEDFEAFLASHPDAEIKLGSYVTSSPDFYKRYSDVVGTHIATTTTGVAISATTSYVSKIGRGISTATYTIKPTDIASSTEAWLRFSVEGSYDQLCDTATSSAADFDMQDVNWFSAGDHLNNKVHATSFTNASTTQSLLWSNPTKDWGQEILLTNLNYECLRLWVEGASSTVYIGLTVK